MIRKLSKNVTKTLNKVEFRIKRVRINRTRPVTLYLFTEKLKSKNIVSESTEYKSVYLHFVSSMHVPL